MENFPLFASAILAAYATKVDSKIVDNIALGYTLSRLFYIYIYITGDTENKSYLRSLTWAGGFGSLMYLLTKAARQL